MLDTGAAPNLIKSGTVEATTPINDKNRIWLSGISKDRIETEGSIAINYLGQNIEFHVVPDTFPISQDGILGADFLQNASTIDLTNRLVLWHGIKLCFTDTGKVKIPARAHSIHAF